MCGYVTGPNPRVWSVSPVGCGAFWSAVFWSLRLGRVLLQHWRFPPASGAVPQAFTPLWGGVGFVAWCLMRPYLGKCRRDRRYFWQCQTRMGNGSTLKRPCAKLACLVGHVTDNCEYTLLTGEVAHLHRLRTFFERTFSR